MGQSLSAEEVDHGCYKAFKFEYKWIIPNFKDLATKKAIGSSTSQTLFLYLDGSKMFQLILYSHGYNERAKDFLSVFLKRNDSNEMLIQFTCALLNSKGKKINVKSIKQKMSIESYLGWILYCRRELLLDDENAILSDGNLTLNCTIEIFESKAIIDAKTEDDDPNMIKSLSKMSTDMIQLLSEGKFSDITFRVEGQDFPVHKAILSTRSPVFKTMMKSQLKGYSKEIIISDIKVETFKQMIHYIYSGNIGYIDVQTTQELYYAADKYELCDLKKICYELLVNNLDINNAIDILLLGHRHSDIDLKVTVIEFIAKNASKIQENEDWMIFLKNYPELANMVFKNHLKKSSKK